MKLTCEIVVNNRNSSGSYNSRPSRGYVAIFRDSKSKPAQLLVAVNSKPKMQFIVDKANVADIFSKHVSNGLSTIRFATPAMDVMISKADPVQLAGLLKNIKAVISGQDVQSNAFSSSSQAAVVPLSLKGPCSLVISQRLYYPFWQPFPASVENLHIRDCDLTEFDSRILKLKFLKTLVLTGNDFSQERFKKVSLASLEYLKTLDLSNNKIDGLSDEFVLPKNLKALTLASNRLTTLPNSLFQIGAEQDGGLSSLNLSNNQLTSLNRGISDLSSTLRRLDVSNNNLTTVPFGIAQLRLEMVDFTGNVFDVDPKEVKRLNIESLKRHALDRQSISSLVDITTVCVIENKLPSNLLPLSLQQYVQYASDNRCDHCHRHLAASHAGTLKLILDLRRVSASSATTVTQGTTVGRYAVVESFYCSSQCASSIQRMSQFAR